MAKLFSKNNTAEMPMANPKYIEEMEQKIPEFEKKLKDIQSKKKVLTRYINEIGIFTVPFNYDDKDNLSIFSSRVTFSWDKYKEYLYFSWRDESVGKTLITQYTDRILYFIWLGITVVALVFGINTEIPSKIGTHPILFILFGYIISELIAGAVSTFYYLIRPNRINKKIAKKKLKEITSEEGIISRDITLGKNLIETWKISSLDPNKQFANVKRKTAEGLHQSLVDTREQVLPSIPETFRNRYKVILDKCEKLLGFAENNGTVVTEISKIYNIYILDINNVLTNSEHQDVAEVITLLNNFEAYVDRKIEKFSTMSKESIRNDINALNKAFSEEI